MKKEMEIYISQLQETFAGDPWFGRNGETLLQETDENMAIQKPGNQHSILELLYHMINWRKFVISRLDPAAGEDLQYFESHDWQELDHTDASLWQQGLGQFQETQQKLLQLFNQMHDEDLDKAVRERKYDNRTLINGIIQHDIYHLGQIAYIKKLLKKA